MLPWYAGAVVAVGAVGLVAAAVFASGTASRMAAFVGVAEATLSSAAALTLKKWALARSLQSALGMIGVTFGMRLILVAAGLAYVRLKGNALVPFVAGFFGVYFVLQWVEISYVLTESKRLGRGGV
jgi:hypothetical protein